MSKSYNGHICKTLSPIKLKFEAQQGTTKCKFKITKLGHYANVILDHPWSAIVGPRLILKFGLDWIYCFGDIAIFIFCRFGLKLPIHALFGGLGFGGIFPQMTSPTVLTLKTHFRTRNYVVYAIKRENRFSVSTWARSPDKRTWQESQTKKSQSGNISPIWGKAPTAPIRTKICVVGSLPDVITYAKFQVDILGVTILQGSNFPFSYWFLHGPYNSAALLHCLW